LTKEVGGIDQATRNERMTMDKTDTRLLGKAVIVPKRLLEEGPPWCGPFDTAEDAYSYAEAHHKDYVIAVIIQNEAEDE
jgi:hypothetical protein